MYFAQRQKGKKSIQRETKFTFCRIHVAMYFAQRQKGKKSAYPLEGAQNSRSKNFFINNHPPKRFQRLLLSIHSNNIKLSQDYTSSGNLQKHKSPESKAK
jgi:hypothetical protein